MYCNIQKIERFHKKVLNITTCKMEDIDEIKMSHLRAIERMKMMSLSPENLFRRESHLYSRFDTDGVPTHDASGNELGKGKMKMLKKQWMRHKKLVENVDDIFI